MRKGIRGIDQDTDSAADDLGEKDLEPEQKVDYGWCPGCEALKDLLYDPFCSARCAGKEGAY